MVPQIIRRMPGYHFIRTAPSVRPAALAILKTVQFLVSVPWLIVKFVVVATACICLVLFMLYLVFLDCYLARSPGGPTEES